MNERVVPRDAQAISTEVSGEESSDLRFDLPDHGSALPLLSPQPPGWVEPPPIPQEMWRDILRALLRSPVYDVQYTRFNEPDRPPYSLIVDFIYLYPDGRVGAALSMLCPCGSDRYLFEVARLTPHKISFIFPDRTYTFGPAEGEEAVYEGYVAHEVKAGLIIPQMGKLELESPDGHLRVVRRIEEAGCGEPGMGDRFDTTLSSSTIDFISSSTAQRALRNESRESGSSKSSLTTRDALP